MRVHGTEAREYYINESANENWSTRNLERNINSFYYERILSSKDKAIVKNEADDETRLLDDNNSPAPKSNIRDFIKDPFVLEFLNLPTNATYKEKDLETALITHLQSFLLELGKGTIDAESVRITRQKLRSQSIFPTQIKEGSL